MSDDDERPMLDWRRPGGRILVFQDGRVEAKVWMEGAQEPLFVPPDSVLSGIGRMLHMLEKLDAFSGHRAEEESELLDARSWLEALRDRV